VTDDQGRFELVDVAPGDHELYVSAVDFILVKRAVRVSAGSIIEVIVVLSEGTAMLAETRSNTRFALPAVNRRTLVATGLYDTMVPLIPAVGVLLEF